MALTPHDLAAAAVVHRRRYDLIGGDRTDRLTLEREERSFGGDLLDRLTGEADMLAFLDVIIETTDDQEYLGYIGAGEVEELLSRRSDSAAAAIEERCRRSSKWAAATECVWMDHSGWLRLSLYLQSLVPEPALPEPASRSLRRSKKKRPSKRQDGHGGRR